MQRIVLGLAVLAVSAVALADDYYTRPHVRRDGTPVQGHRSTNPNEFRYDNYSGRGNVNPYTGQTGTQRHEFTTPPAYNQPRHTPSPTYGNPYGNSNSNPYGSQRRNPYGRND